MIVRTLRTTDLLRVLLDTRSMGPDWAQTWEKVGGNMDSAPHASSVARGLLLRRERERCSVLVDGLHLRALASVRARSGPRAWEVHCLNISPEMEQEGTELLERLCILAGDQGGERVFLRLPALCRVVQMVKDAGFIHCCQETLYRRDSVPAFASLAAKFIRPIFPADAHAVYGLYNACVPSKVRATHALTFDEWSDALEPSGKRVQQCVYEAQGGIRGWGKVGSAQRSSNMLEVMVHPQEDTSTWEDLVSWALQQGTPEASFLALVPNYQPTLSLVLEKRGFIPTREYHLMVKSIAVRVKDPALAPMSA